MAPTRCHQSRDESDGDGEERLDTGAACGAAYLLCRSRCPGGQGPGQFLFESFSRITPLVHKHHRALDNSGVSPSARPRERLVVVETFLAPH